MTMKRPLLALFVSALAWATVPLNAQVFTAAPNLPSSPPGVYVSSPSEIPQFPTPVYPFVWLRNLCLYGWTGEGSPNVQATFDVCLDMRHFNLVSASGPLAWSNNDPAGTGTFATELTQLELSGEGAFGAFYLRASPDHASVGQTTVMETGSGGYSIDSYFDVWPEISFDDANWYATNYPLEVTLQQVPEPAALALLGLGAFGLRFSHLRRRGYLGIREKIAEPTD
jgi:PEP-CTERM motif